ncbi:MAG TPA: AsmA family protein [Acidobacteriaceae bacterium]|nr:AsmA family protein [Acidobacteriaceae bacterium]
MTRFALIAVGAVVALVILVAICLPLFLNADSFRARIESTLTKSLGRKVTIGKLDLSVWSGGLVATNATVADDPAFSTQPFIQADSVKIGVEILPLIFSKQIHIRGFSLQSPKVQLFRAANGTWNYSTIGKSAPTAQDADTKQAFPDLTVGHVTVENGRFTVGTQPAAGGSAGAPARVYDQVNLEVKDFGFRNAFPFTASAHLPADGTVSLSGKAGPINQQDASATPFSGHLEMKHIDPLAAGFVDASDGVTGLVNSMILDASWNGQQMHVTKLLVDSPNIKLVRSNAPKPPAPAGANPEGTTMLQNLSVDDAQIKNGSVTLTTAGQTGAAVYQQLNAQIANLTPKTSSPFNVSGQLPGGGTLSANGRVGPFNQANNAATPLNAHVTLKHVELGSSGILPPDAGIGGIADLQAQVQSDGQTLNATGSTQIAGIKLAKDGQPSAKPVQLQFAVAQNEQAMTGQLQKATFTVGRATINASGTYQASGPTTAINLKVIGDSVPIDELVAFLPALGVRLPQGSQLKGGTLTTALTVSGSSANPVISGPVRLNNTQLAGFDLGSKLQTLSQLTGGKIGSATGSGTNIRSLSMNIREAGGGIQTDNIALDVTGVGTATGAGSVSAAGALNYNVVLKLTGLVGGAGNSASAASGGGGKAALLGGLAGMIPGGAGGAAGSIGGLAGGVLRNGIPVAIGGTTSNPTFSPNLAGLASGIGASALKGKTNGKQNGTQSNPLGNALGGLLNRH